MDVKHNTRCGWRIPGGGRPCGSGGLGGRSSAWLRRARGAVVRVAPAGSDTLPPVTRRWPEAGLDACWHGHAYARLRPTHARCARRAPLRSSRVRLLPSLPSQQLEPTGCCLPLR